MIEHMGIKARVAWDERRGLFRGRIIGLGSNNLTFEAQEAGALMKAFKSIVQAILAGQGLHSTSGVTGEHVRPAA